MPPGPPAYARPVMSRDCAMRAFIAQAKAQDPIRGAELEILTAILGRLARIKILVGISTIMLLILSWIFFTISFRL